MEPWQRLDEAGEADARRLLSTCCGATRWVDGMLTRRPFRSRRGLLDAAQEVWTSLTPADWREAFTHHPKIGERDAPRTRFAATRTLSETEQAGVRVATDAVLDALSEGNRLYQQRFGYIFIVCATGKTADEMLALLHSRLGNDPAQELHIAAAEQGKITAIRLESLAESRSGPRRR